ncbi:MAG: TetR family transcriptional regulator [Acidimicrobiia bacterium]
MCGAHPATAPSEGGFSETTMDNVADAAGVSRRTAYRRCDTWFSQATAAV